MGREVLGRLELLASAALSAGWPGLWLLGASQKTEANFWSKYGACGIHARPVVGTVVVGSEHKVQRWRGVCALMWKTSRCPASSAFLVCAYFSSLSCTLRDMDSPALSLKLEGWTWYRSELPGLTEQSTAAWEVFVIAMSCTYACTTQQVGHQLLDSAIVTLSCGSQADLVQAHASVLELGWLEAQQAMLLH